MTICVLDSINMDKVLKTLKTIHYEEGMGQDIYIFTNVYELLKYCTTNTVNIVITEEKVEDVDGYEIAYHLKMKDANTLPIIISAEEKIDIRAGRTELFGYLASNNIESRLPELIAYASKRQQASNTRLLYYQWRNSERSVALNSILYFCSDHRVIRYKRLGGEQEEFYYKLDMLDKTLKENNLNFIRISKSFLVNSKYILRKTRQEILLINGETLLISRRYKENLKI